MTPTAQPAYERRMLESTLVSLTFLAALDLAFQLQSECPMHRFELALPNTLDTDFVCTLC